jgi:hypothetical protein
LENINSVEEGLQYRFKDQERDQTGLNTIEEFVDPKAVLFGIVLRKPVNIYTTYRGFFLIVKEKNNIGGRTAEVQGNSGQQSEKRPALLRFKYIQAK